MFRRLIPSRRSPAAGPAHPVRISRTDVYRQSWCARRKAIDTLLPVRYWSKSTSTIEDGKLMPGAYTEVHMDVHEGVAPMIIPVSALIFRNQGLQVGTVLKGSNGDEAKLVQVTLGQDDGSTVQVIHGLSADSPGNPESTGFFDRRGTGARRWTARDGGGRNEGSPTHLSPVNCPAGMAILSGAALLLSGCTVGPNYQGPYCPDRAGFQRNAPCLYRRQICPAEDGSK